MAVIEAKKPKFTRDLPASRRQQLIDATARCLAKFGLDGTSVRHVAAEAGVSPGLVRHHFEGMHDLIAETYRHTGRQVSAALKAALDGAGSDPEAQLRAFIDASFAPPLLDPDLLAVWLTFWSLTRTDPEIHAIHGKVYGDYRQRLAGLIGGLADTKGPGTKEADTKGADARKTERDTRLASLAFTALLDGLWLEHCLDPSTFSAAEARVIVHSWVDALKDGRFMTFAAPRDGTQ